MFKITSLLLACCMLASPFSYATDTTDGINNQNESEQIEEERTKTKGENTNDKYEGIVKKININDASAEEIAAILDGIGLKKATAIVDYRDQHGSFQQAEDLVKVKGIGPKTLERNRDKLLLVD